MENNWKCFPTCVVILVNDLFPKITIQTTQFEIGDEFKYFRFSVVTSCLHNAISKLFCYWITWRNFFKHVHTSMNIQIMNQNFFSITQEIFHEFRFYFKNQRNDHFDCITSSQLTLRFDAGISSRCTAVCVSKSESCWPWGISSYFPL